MSLKPCPFCGCEHYLSHITEMLRLHYVSCECGAVGPAREQRDAAAMAWNERKAPDQQEAARAAIAAATGSDA